MLGHTLEPRGGHKILLVKFKEEEWLADVGFGGYGLSNAIPFQVNQIGIQKEEFFRLIFEEPYGYILQSQHYNHWENIYSFTLESYFPFDCEYANYSLSNMPSSHFVKNVVCEKATSTGHILLEDRYFKIKEKGRIIENIFIKDRKTYLEILEKEFNLKIAPTQNLFRALNF